VLVLREGSSDSFNGGLESQQNVFRKNPMTVSLHWGQVIYRVAHLLAEESKH
jgi:hypothetical protein